MRTGEALARAAIQAGKAFVEVSRTLDLSMRAVRARFGYCERCPGVCHRLDVAAGLCSVCRRPMTPL